jgi:WD40 repeat protein
MALSPDGRWAICRPSHEPSSVLQLIPTGPGEPRTVEGHGVFFTAVRWLPDGRRVVASAAETGQRTRVVLLELGQGRPTAITPEGVTSWVLAPDGSAIAARAIDGSIRIYGLDGMVQREVPGLTGHELPVDWITDGVLVSRTEDTASPLGQIYLLDIETGRQVPWRSVLLQEPAGIMHPTGFRATPDGRSHAYSWHLALSNLYLADGLV